MTQSNTMTQKDFKEYMRIIETAQLPELFMLEDILTAVINKRQHEKPIIKTIVENIDDRVEKALNIWLTQKPRMSLSKFARLNFVTVAQLRQAAHKKNV